MKIPPAVFASGSTRRIRTRSCNGRSLMGGLLGPKFVGKIWHCAIASANERPPDMGARPLNTTVSNRFIYFLFRQPIVLTGYFQFDHRQFLSAVPAPRWRAGSDRLGYF